MLINFRNKYLSKINNCLLQISQNLDLKNTTLLMIFKNVIQNAGQIKFFTDPKIALETVQLYESIFRATQQKPDLQKILVDIGAKSHLEKAYDLYIRSVIMNEMKSKNTGHLDHVNSDKLFFFLQQNLTEIFNGPFLSH